MPLREVLAALDARYDPALAESWDAVGLVCGDPDEPVRRVVFAVDPTSAVVDDVVAAGAELLVTHHPLLLTPVHGVPTDDPKGRLVHRLIRARAGLVVAHTNADRAPETGVNDALAEVLGLRDAVPLEPADGDPRAGLGRVGDLESAVTLREFAARAAAVLPATVGGVRAAGDPDRLVRRVAVPGLQRHPVPHPEDGGQGVVDPVVGGAVGVCVRDEQAGVAADQAVHEPALRVVGGHPVDRGQQQRVMGDQQVGVGRQHVVDDAGRRVDGKQHPPHRLVRVAADQADGVPALGEGGVVTGIERGEHLAQGHGHGSGVCPTSRGPTQQR